MIPVFYNRFAVNTADNMSFVLNQCLPDASELTASSSIASLLEHSDNLTQVPRVLAFR